MLLENNTWTVFDEFAKHPSRRFHLRELAKKTGLSTTAVKRQLKALLKAKLITTDKETLYETHKASQGNEDYHYYKKIRNLHALRRSGITAYLESKTSPDCIILFGSYERGEDTEDSDIDLYVQATDRKTSVKRHEKQLNKPVQLVFAQNLRELPQELKNNIINGTILSGFINDTDTHHPRQGTSEKHHKTRTPQA